MLAQPCSGELLMVTQLLSILHPTMTCLVSSRLHHLPQHLALKLSLYSSGNSNAEVLAKLKAMIWRDDVLTYCTSRIVTFAITWARRNAERIIYLEDSILRIPRNRDKVGSQSPKWRTLEDANY